MSDTMLPIEITDEKGNSFVLEDFQQVLELKLKLEKTSIQAMRIIQKLRIERQEFKDNLQVCENELEFLGKKLDELLIVAKRLDE